MSNAAANDVTDPRAALASEYARLANVAKGHTLGAKYRANMTGPEIAKAIRADIKAAQKAGDLPAMTVSVRSRLSTHAMAIDVEIKAWSGQVWSTARARYDVMRTGGPIPSRLSHSASLLLDAVKSYADAYNYDRSDLATDYHNVNFFGSVDFAPELTDASREATEAAVRGAYGAAS
jgi:hypothetical protein